ncbi:inovirus Gp2 family protein [uncultured Serratia sp.]|uniref:inovirus Gp2 family protein n=1 Tax=uncultured Serratia sp. TaxID=239175 RepID=UPI00258C4779|nr:inovirus Gp2 family protein [uncultured Serratia sp.]
MINTQLPNRYGPLNQTYVDRITGTIGKAMKQYPRLLAIRIDLRFPDEEDRVDCPTQCYRGPDVISRFINSMKAQVKADLKRKKKAGKRGLNCKLRYVWVREFGNKGGGKHYHVLLLVNKDVYSWPGYYLTERFSDGISERYNLSHMVVRAWLKAIGRGTEEKKYHGLVHFPEQGYYLITRNHVFMADILNDLTDRALYLAKMRSKDTSDGYRSFGCSQD